MSFQLNASSNSLIRNDWQTSLESVIKSEGPGPSLLQG